MAAFPGIAVARSDTVNSIAQSLGKGNSSPTRLPDGCVYGEYDEIRFQSIDCSSARDCNFHW